MPTVLDRADSDQHFIHEEDLEIPRWCADCSMRLRHPTRTRLSISLLVLLLLAGAAAAQQAPVASDAPILTLDAGGHTATVSQVLFAAGGRELISAGDDKTVRVWDTETGETLRVLHGQVGPGPEGMFYALALSPDGRTLAVAG